MIASIIAGAEFFLRLTIQRSLLPSASK